MPSNRRVLWSVVAICLAAAGIYAAAVISISRERSHQLQMYPSATGSYWGADIFDGPGLLGRNYYKVVYYDEDFGQVVVEFDDDSLGSFRAVRETGEISAEGTCLIHFPTMHKGEPAPDLGQIRSARFFLPNGELASDIVEGTGEQTLWYADGTQRESLTYKRYLCVKRTSWYPSGQLKEETEYAQQLPHGSHIEYFPSGKAKIRGRFHKGRPSGAWTEYDEQQQVVSEKRYD